MPTPDELLKWISLIAKFPITLMIIGAVIFGLGLYWKIWPPAVERAVAQQQVPLTPGASPNFNFQGPSTNQFNFNPPPAAPPARDPDTLYQLGQPVGQVEKVAIDIANSRITFELIRGAMNLDLNREVEYRRYTLRLERPAAEAGQREGPQGRWIERRLYQVQGQIVNATP